MVLRFTLLFRRVPSEISSLLRASGILSNLIGRHLLTSCPRILSAFPWSFGDNFNTSCHVNCSPKTQFLSFHRLGTREFVWYLVNTSSHGDLRPKKLKFFIPISSDEKTTTSGFRVLAYHLASFFFLHFPQPCYSFGLLYWPLYPLLYPPGHRV